MLVLLSKYQIMADDDDCVKPICKDNPYGNMRKNLGDFV